MLLLFLMLHSVMIVSWIQSRYLIAFGWLAPSFGMYYSTQHLDLEISFRAASVIRVVQVFGLGFLFVPITLVSYVGMPAAKSNSVAGLVNFMRNIGSSIGTSMVTTLIARRAQVHQVYLVAHINPGQSTLTQAVTALRAHLTTSGLDASRAMRQAYGQLLRGPI